MDIHISSWLIWLVGAVVLTLLEVFLSGFVLLCFAFGLFTAALVSFVGGGIEFQITSIILTTVIAFVTIYPSLLGLRNPRRLSVLALVGVVVASFGLWTYEIHRTNVSSEERESDERNLRAKFSEMMTQFIGQPAPDFSFETVSGERHRLSDFRGKYVLLDFWGSWCVPCVAEIPNLVKVYEKFGDRGLVMISISNDASVSKWDRTNLAEYTEKKGMKWFQVLDDTSNSIHDLFQIQFWPNMFLIDRDGNVVRRDGLRDNELMDVLSALLVK